MPAPIQLDNGLYLIDLRFQGAPGVIASYLLAGPGDVAGVRLQGPNYVRPPTPPPELDPALWNGSIDRIMALTPIPAVLYLTHFGPFADAPRHLHELRTRLQIWGDIIHTAMRASPHRADVIQTLETAATPALRIQADADTVARYELAATYGMSVD